MLKRTGRRDRDLLKLTWTKMSERKVQKSDHQLPFLIELATQLNFFFLARNKRFGGIGGRLIRTGLRMKQGSYVFSVWIFRMRKRTQRMSIFKRNSINSNVQQNLPIANILPDATLSKCTKWAVSLVLKRFSKFCSVVSVKKNRLCSPSQRKLQKLDLTKRKFYI